VRPIDRLRRLLWHDPIAMPPDDGRAPPKKSILYYPTIAIPTGAWLRQSLLYWDEVGSIVPQQWETDNKYPKHIQYLISEEEFRPVRPELLIRSPVLDRERQKLDAEFRAVIDSPQFRQMLVVSPGRAVRDVNYATLTQGWRVHEAKVDDSLLGSLIERGLARRRSPHADWHQFEPLTGQLYISLLAKYLADLEPDSTVPGTDLRTYERLIYDAPRAPKSVRCVDMRFLRALPVPREDVALKTIVTFKRKRRTELLHFREELSKFQRQISEAEESQVNHLVTDFANRLERRVDELGAVLRDSRLETVAGSFKAILNVKSPKFWGALGGTTVLANVIASHPMEWTMAGFGVMGSIELAQHWINARNKERAVLRHEGFAYLYHADAARIL